MERKGHGLSVETKRYIKEQMAKRLRYFPRTESPLPQVAPHTTKPKKHRRSRLPTYENQVKRLRLPRDGSADLLSLDLRAEIAYTALQIHDSRTQVQKIGKSRRLPTLSSSLNRLLLS